MAEANLRLGLPQPPRLALAWRIDYSIMRSMNHPRPQPSALVSPVEWERRLLAMHGATDTDEFIDAVFTLLQGTVKCDFTLANLRNVDGVPLMARDSLGREFGIEYMERFFKANPSVGYVMMRPGLRILHTKDHLPQDAALKSLPFYTEFMQPENWRHSVALLFWGFFPPVPQNAFCVFRSAEQADFDENDLAQLRLVHPHINTALKRLKKQLKARSADDRITALLNSLPGNATLLDWDLRITNMSTSARRLSAQWSGREKESLPRTLELPPELLAACAEMKAEWRAQSEMMSKRVVPHSTQPALSAEITLVLQQESVLAHPGFLVRLNDNEGTSATLARSTPATLSLLSPAEREAVLLVGEGLINAEIAVRLGISIAAVKLRLHGAFKKLNVRTRTQLAALLR
jgi:DNA-binding CsgD family transcriptional regulator